MIYKIWLSLNPYIKLFTIQFKSKMSNSAGFTLVELMVVVAIIGLLSSVAIPNFKKFQAKSKTTEAKVHLSAIYTAEMGFFSDYNMYGACLRYMGYDPSNEKPSRYYSTGFFWALAQRNANAHASAVNSGLNEADCPASQALFVGDGNTEARATTYLAGKGVGGQIMGNAPYTSVTGNMGAGSQANEATMTFVAGAAGYISDKLTGGGSYGGYTWAANIPAYSLFSINQNKIIINHSSGY